MSSIIGVPQPATDSDLDQGEHMCSISPFMLSAESLCKAEIEEFVQRFIKTNLESTDSGTLYIMLKQWEYAIKTGIDHLKNQAFNSLGEQLGGLSSGKFLGHDVVISYPNEWHYSSDVEDLKSRQKRELTELQEKEQRTGTAERIQGKGRVTVTLRDR